MYKGWTLVLTLVVALLCDQIHGIWWPFIPNAAAAVPELDQIYPDSSARRIAVIGTYQFAFDVCHAQTAVVNRSGFPLQL